MKWTDSREIAIALAETHPGIDPARVLFVDLREWVLALPGFDDDPKGLSLQTLLDNPHGVDLGPLEPRIPECLRTPSGMIELAPEPIVADTERLRASLGAHLPDRGLPVRPDLISATRQRRRAIPCLANYRQPGVEFPEQ